VTAASACFGGHSDGCPAGFAANQTTLTLQSPANAWATGTYSLIVTADGYPARCHMVVDDSTLAAPARLEAACAALDVGWSLDPVCLEPPSACSGSACQQTGSTANCLPGQFQMNVVIPGDPSPIGIDLSLDGAVLLSQSVTPQETTTQPGGPSCAATTQGTATIALADGGAASP
jgi:hypothetical protein